MAIPYISVFLHVMCSVFSNIGPIFFTFLFYKEENCFRVAFDPSPAQICYKWRTAPLASLPCSLFT